jgi:hypothetical protein
MYRKELLVPGRSEPKRPLLAEIKYREDLAKDWKLLKPKFRAARAYARERDWDFAITSSTSKSSRGISASRLTLAIFLFCFDCVLLNIHND